jgi:hypothetical protein
MFSWAMLLGFFFAGSIDAQYVVLPLILCVLGIGSAGLPGAGHRVEIGDSHNETGKRDDWDHDRHPFDSQEAS